MNKKLEKIFLDDWEERKHYKEWGKTISLEEVQKRDAKRLSTVLKMIKDKQLKDGMDYFHAARILQHSTKIEHYKLANELSYKAIELGEDRAKWLFAASLDRYLTNTGQDFQKFGTQFKKDNSGKWRLIPVDPETTDEDRAFYNVPPLNKLKAKEKELNS